MSRAQCGLQSGPMAGYSDMLEVTIWVQTKCAQDVQLRYWLSGHPDTSWLSDPVTTSAEHGFCAHLIANRVTPGNNYNYEILIDDETMELPYSTTFVTQPLWQWRTNPADFSFVAGSCAYVNEEVYDRPGKPYGGDYHIFSAIQADDPDMMVWLGDNIYLREVDWNTKTGIYHRNTHTRSLPELQPLLASTHHYATWDDHDYGPNDSDRSYWGKDITLQAFKDFWANPNYGVGGTEGITGTFFREDCQFFIMDNRWYRAPRHGTGEYYGKEQLIWLIDALRYSKAPYKFICTGGQILNDAAVFENYAQFPAERRALLDSIDKYNIKGIVFLTGDRHHSEISRMRTADGDVFYDITSSALTSNTFSHPDESNNFRIPGSMIGVRNYVLISVSGPLNERKCKVVFKDANGVVLNEYELE
ncbi:MAG TPA: alkaline phosphatase D family protein [Saprospiraceae bacterium]|nr:alkaline phosphatase D family protein [Saprospiraceae bacterium]